jgi:hypothetical protein
MDPVITEMAASAVAGGLFQGVSEIFKLGQGFITTLRDVAISNNEQARKNAELDNKNANAAAKRTQPWLTATLAIIVIVAAFLLPFIAGWMDMPTQIVSDEEPFSMLWGLITFGGGKIVTQAQGFVQGPEFWSTVRMVAGFVFGVKAVSTGSRLF